MRETETDGERIVISLIDIITILIFLQRTRKSRGGGGGARRRRRDIVEIVTCRKNKNNINYKY